MALYEVFLAVYLSAAVAQSASPVYFSLIVSYGEFGFNSSGGIPAVDIALDYINRSQLLPGYELGYKTVKNSKCTRGDSLDAFFDEFQFDSTPKIALIGCGCSTATEPVAEISHQWNIPQISFASALSSLSDRSRFRYYFRTTPTFNNYAPALVALLNNFKWKRVAFITQKQTLFVKVYSDLKQLLENLQTGASNLCCFDNLDIATEYVDFETNEDPVAAAETVFREREFHVMFLNCFSKHARRLLCEAAKHKLLYPHYAWLIYDWYPDRWWTEKVANETIDECSDEVVEAFLIQSRALLIDIRPEGDDNNEVTDAGVSAKNFTELYETKLNSSNYEYTSAYAVAFDAVWALAEALNKTEEMRNCNETVASCTDLDGDLVPLDQFNSSNGLMGCTLKYNLHQTDFLGVSGPVRFGEDGTIIYTKIWLAQIRVDEKNDIQRTRFGYIDRASDYQLNYEEGEDENTVFPGGVPPDGAPIQVIHTYNTGLIIVYYTTATAGIVLAIVCIAFNFIFRNRKVIRLTSPKLNYFIISGSVLMYLSVFFELVPTTQEVVFHSQCIIHTWLYCIGYLLVYGTILAKMWRIYHIFHNPTPNKKVLQTWHLLCGVLCIAGLGGTLVLAKTIGQVLTPPHLVPDLENPSATTMYDIREEYSVWRCYDIGSPPFYLALLIFIYLALLQIVGIILAFQTRKVKIRVLNDSKFVAALVYISSIVLVIIVLTTFILRSYINISAALFSGGIIILATISLALMFIPKMINLYQDPKGQKVFENTNPTNKSEKGLPPNSSIPAGLSELTDKERVTLLETRLESMEKEMQEKTKRISELENCINS